MASVAAQVPGGLTAYPPSDQASTLTESRVTLGVLALKNTGAPPQKDAQGAPEGQEPDHSSEDGSVATAAVSTTNDPKPSGNEQKLQQTESESASAEDDPQQLLNQYLVGFNIMETPADNFCWLHAIHLSADQSVSTLIKTLIDMIDHHLPDNEQAVATEHSDFLTRWINAQGEKNVRLVRKQLIKQDWPDLNILLPLLSYLFKKTFVVVNLHASGLTQDQVFAYATSNHVQVTVVSEASAINTPEETIYLGLLSRDNHFVGIQPDSRYNKHSHSCPVCREEFTKDRAIKSTSCFHYLCDECLKKLNKHPVWACPVCRNQQKYIESISDSDIATEPEIEVMGINISNSVRIGSSWVLHLDDLLPFYSRIEFTAPLETYEQTYHKAMYGDRNPKPKLYLCDHEGCNYVTHLRGCMKRHKKTQHSADQ